MPTAKYRPHRAALAEVAAAPVPALAVRFRIHRAEVRAGLNCGCDFRRHRYATTLEFDREIVWDSRSGSRSVDGLRARNPNVNPKLSLDRTQGFSRTDGDRKSTRLNSS